MRPDQDSSVQPGWCPECLRPIEFGDYTSKDDDGRTYHAGCLSKRRADEPTEEQAP